MQKDLHTLDATSTRRLQDSRHPTHRKTVSQKEVMVRSIENGESTEKRGPMQRCQRGKIIEKRSAV